LKSEKTMGKIGKDASEANSLLDLSTLNNISQHEEFRRYLPFPEKIQELVKAFLDNSAKKVLAILTLAYIVDKDKAGTSLVFGKDLFIEIINCLKAIFKGKSFHGAILSLKEVLLGVVNLSVNDGNKVILHDIGIIQTLLEIIQVDPTKPHPERVLQGLDEAKALAAKILWNLSFAVVCLNDIKIHLDILKSYANSENKILRANIIGILFEIAQHNTPAPTSNLQAEKKKHEEVGSERHIMISYQWGSQEIVKKIAFALQDAGYKIWLDIEEMQGSTLEAMADAVERSYLVLVCMTRKYKESPNCRSEAEYTNNLRKEFIPLMLESDYQPDGWLGILLGSKLYYKFDENNFEATFKNLMKAIGTKGRPTSEKLIKELTKPLEPIIKENAISKWKVEDVAQWLEENYLSQYKEKFITEKMTGVALLKLASALSKESFPTVLAVLEKLFGVVPCGDLLTLISALEKLR